MKFPIIAAALLFGASVFAAEPNAHRDLPYAEPKNVRQMLDVYSPPDATNRPIVFWIHGGGWVRGDKSEVKLKPAAFVDRGYVFVAINYRFLPDATIKEITGDVAKALHWVHRNARQYGGDPNSIFVMGHSAGAQLAALVCIDDRYLKAEGLSLRMVKGCVPVDGDTYDVATQVKMVEAVQQRPFFISHRNKFGHEAALEELSAVTHVARDKGISPFLIIHVADFPQSRTGLQSHLLATRLIHHGGVSAKVLAVPGKTHITLDSDLGAAGDATTDAILDFVKTQLKPAPSTATR
ncbi:MAG: alpha/beta hydrolase [Opitutaceae bacterium]